MKAIGFFNNKGGVGKTTLLCNTAAYLSINQGKRILVVDADPQANASQLMIEEAEFDHIFSNQNVSSFTIYSIARPLSVGKGFTQSIKPRRIAEYGVDLIVGDPRLALVEDTLAQDWGRSRDVRGMRTSLMFRKFIEYAQEYDYVFFDMSPSLGAINRSVLLACDYFILPMATDIFSLRATENISSWISKWKKDYLKNIVDFDEDDLDELEVNYIKWRLHLLGYVTQQYNQKTVDGSKRVVKSYEKIIARIPEKIEETLVAELEDPPLGVDYFLGTIPHLHSLVPMSQSVVKPIFKLKAADGIVGSHFSRVKDADKYFKNISQRLMKNLSSLSHIDD